MLTDDDIRNLQNYVCVQTSPATVHELCTRLLSAEARVKVLEDALQKIGEIAFGHQDSKFVEIYIAARTALQEQC
jgi:hypothetical protein